MCKVCQFDGEQCTIYEPIEYALSHGDRSFRHADTRGAMTRTSGVCVCGAYIHESLRAKADHGIVLQPLIQPTIFDVDRGAVSLPALSQIKRAPLQITISSRHHRRRISRPARGNLRNCAGFPLPRERKIENCVRDASYRARDEKRGNRKTRERPVFPSASDLDTAAVVRVRRTTIYMRDKECRCSFVFQ